MCVELELQASPMDARAASHTPCKLTEDTNSYYWGKVPGQEYHAWLCAYLNGYLPPHYPVPALLDHEPMVAMARAHWFIQSEPCTWE